MSELPFSLLLTVTEGTENDWQITKQITRFFGTLMTSGRPERFKTVLACFANSAAKSEEVSTNSLKTNLFQSIKILAEIAHAHC